MTTMEWLGIGAVAYFLLKGESKTPATQQGAGSGTRNPNDCPAGYIWATGSDGNWTCVPVGSANVPYLAPVPLPGDGTSYRIDANQNEQGVSSGFGCHCGYSTSDVR